MFYTTKHFQDRVRQRLPGVSPKKLAEGIVWAIQNGRDDLVWYAGRIKRGNEVVRRFSFTSLCGSKRFCAIVSDKGKKMAFVTVYKDDEE